MLPSCPAQGCGPLYKALNLPQPWLLPALCRISVKAAAAADCHESDVKQHAAAWHF